VNDPTKPEFDDQGYTLYTDNETGKKSRVFEALVDYPCEFTMKIVGKNEGSFVEEIVAVVADACESSPENISHSVRAVGKWTSVTVQAPVKSSEMLYALYEKVDLDPRVKFKF
jgi:putative lipoic acid-binding regulatory protein